MSGTQQRLAECLRLLEETGDVESCLALYPDLGDEITQMLAAMTSARALGPREPVGTAASLSRRIMLSALEPTSGGRWMLGKLSPKVGAALAALVLAMVGAVGAAAAGRGPNQPGFVNDILSSVGVVEPAQATPAVENHGTDVSDRVHQALRTPTPGTNIGTVACEAAQDRATLPGTAQNAHPDEDADCNHEGHDDDATPTPQSGVSTQALQPGATPTPNHGQSVSSAVHDAIATSTPGPGRGQAVSEAACTAAHDRSTLPSQAQNAKPQDGDDCVHPNASGTPGNGSGSGGANANRNGIGHEGPATGVPTPHPGSSSNQSGPGSTNPNGLGQPTGNQSQGGGTQGAGRPPGQPNGPAQNDGPGQGHGR